MSGREIEATPQEIAMAEKIERMAVEPVNDLIRRMKFTPGFKPMFQAIVLEAMAHAALKAAAKARGGEQP